MFERPIAPRGSPSHSSPTSSSFPPAAARSASGEEERLGVVVHVARGREGAVSRDGTRGSPLGLPGPAILRHPGFAPPQALVHALRLGHPVILCDDEDRENEGDLVFAAQFASPALVNLAIRACGGLVCVALSPTLVALFGLEPMVPHNTCPRGTAFTASVDAAAGIGTGISARDRARTIRLLGAPSTRPDQLMSPGHVFPLAARGRGLAERQGHTEGAVALAQSAELVPAAAICEILDAEGEAMQRDELLVFAREHSAPIGTVAALARWWGATAPSGGTSGS